MNRTTGILVTCIAIAGGACSHDQHHGYMLAESSKQVRSLTETEVTNYLEGRGMGLAKPAELNSYPGPMHVLELADKLELTEEQRRETQQIFDSMRAEATRLGKFVVEKEGELNRAFAEGSVDREGLTALVSEIGRLQSELRVVHLATHIEMKKLLTQSQIDKYDELRGYRPAS